MFDLVPIDEKIVTLLTKSKKPMTIDAVCARITLIPGRRIYVEREIWRLIAMGEIEHTTKPGYVAISREVTMFVELVDVALSWYNWCMQYALSPARLSRKCVAMRLQPNN